MAASKVREFTCGVIREPVHIQLKNKRTPGMRSADRLFVQCDQAECQYVDENRPPCPLSLGMFEAEIKAREEAARLRKEQSDLG
ncbi:MAG TPA: hypothetical protein PK668_05295 [Myxococcota bacterium]|nr:hypothetical protein [Myxococcota bacterium]HRY92274.1 hypothetical protein [Myxococcota bacterium]HSA22892.1 hypothetical protein [Myxococcota bacterium]